MGLRLDNHISFAWLSSLASLTSVQFLQKVAKEAKRRGGDLVAALSRHRCECYPFQAVAFASIGGFVPTKAVKPR